MLIHFEINEESGSRRKRKMKKKVNLTQIVKIQFNKEIPKTICDYD